MKCPVMPFYGGVGTCVVTPVQQSDFANENECLLLLQCCHLQNKQYKHYNDTEPRITDTQLKEINLIWEKFKLHTSALLH